MTKKIFIFFIIFLCVLAAGVYFVSGKLLEIGTREALKYLVMTGKMYKLEIEDPRFEDARFLSYKALAWRGVTAKVRVAQSGIHASQQEFVIRIEEATLSMQGFYDRLFTLDARGMKIVSNQVTGIYSHATKKQGYQLEANQFRMGFEWDFLNKRAAVSQIQFLLRNLEDFLRNGKSVLLIEFSGTNSFLLRQKLFKINMLVQKKDQEYLLVLDRNDMERVASLLYQELELEKKLTEAEIDLLTYNPLKSAQLLRVMDYAITQAKEVGRREPKTDTASFRHALWSFTLTKSYGEAFAKVVTDAHEIGDYGESEAAHQQAYNNNAIGRRYASAGYEESSILERVKHDPKIIRSP